MQVGEDCHVLLLSIPMNVFLLRAQIIYLLHLLINNKKIVDIMPKKNGNYC